MDGRLSLLNEHSDWVRGLARHLVADPHLAEDVAQDTLVAALAAGQTERSWLGGVVRKLAANRQRARLRRLRRETGVAFDAGAGSSAAVETVARVEEERLLLDAVLALDEPFRDVVLLRYYDDLPRREIARRLGVPVATVNSRLTRAQARLREQLDRAHGGDGQAWLVALAPVAVSLDGRGASVLATTGASNLLGVLVMKKLSLAAAAMVLGGLSVWMVTAAGPTPQTAGVGRGETGAVPMVVSAPAADVDASGDPGPAPPSAVRNEVWSPPTADAHAGAAVVDPGLATLRIQVVDGSSLRPQPGAAVRCITPTPRFMRQVRERMQSGTYSMESLFEFGKPVALDDEARFDVPDSPVPRFFLARQGDLRGAWSVRPGRLEEEAAASGGVLSLMPMQRVRVRVVDAVGRPVGGVPVALGAGEERAWSPQSIVPSADADGLVELAWAPMPGLVPPGPLSVRLWFPGAPRALTKIGDPGQQGPPILLRCPPIGEVVVRIPELVDAEPGNLVLLDDGDSVGGREVFPGRMEAGEARFAPVAVGMELVRARVFHLPKPTEFDANAGIGGDLLRTLSGPGPRAAGDTVVLNGAELRYQLAARVFQGTPERARILADTKVLGMVVRREEGDSWQVRTDGDGALVLPVIREDVSAEAPLDLELVLADGPRSIRRVRVTEDQLLAAPVQWGVDGDGVATVDLGALYFAAARVFSRGVVVDAQGAPVAGVSVQMGFLGTDEWSDTPHYVPHPMIPAYRSDADGRFEVVGPDDAVPAPGLGGEVWMAIPGHPRWVREPVPVADPMDARLVVRPLGGLAGRLLVDALPSLGGLSVVLQPFGAADVGADKTIAVAAESGGPAHPSTWRRRSEPRTDGRFSFDRLPAGRCTLHVLLAGGREVLRVEDLAVVAGESLRPARLEPVDLRGRVVSLRLDVRDEQGQVVVADVLLERGSDAIGRTDRAVLLLPGEHRLVLRAADHEDLKVDTRALPPVLRLRKRRG